MMRILPGIRTASFGVWIAATAVAICVSTLFASSALAGFGIKDFSVTTLNHDGSVDLQAGSHPYEYRVSITMNQDATGFPEGVPRELILDLPPGLLGNPQAVPRCDATTFEGQSSECPGNSQVGVVHLDLGAIQPVYPVYNLSTPVGAPVRLGFSLVALNSFQDASLRAGDYGATISDQTIPNIELRSITETIWGVPADPRHDGERQCVINTVEIGCSTETARRPFLSLPTSCTGPLTTTLRVDSIEEPNVYQSKSIPSRDENNLPAGLQNCEALPFNPSITTRPEVSTADSPTGLHVDLHIPQNHSPEGLAEADLKDTVLTLPAGMVVNTSAADGLGACPLTGSSAINLPGSGEPSASQPAKCPDNSKIGAVEIDTPLIDHPVKGSVYLAKQNDNPFNSLLALYLAVNDPQTGIVVKLAGKIAPDPTTGRLTATFLNNPQLPFEDLDVDFFGGPRAALTTPSSCGTYTTTSALTPWTAPEGATVKPFDAFQISTGANNGPCVANEAQEPNSPTFEAGTVTPLAGSYSPFVLKLSRENGSQRLGALNVTLPPGLTGRLAGVQECSDAQLAQAAGRNHPGEGSLEQAGPSCPQSSEVGTITTGVGSGSPLFVGGHAYLAGPYEGAPLSVAIVAPAVAGPFDLGNVVVRTALFIDPSTAQVTVKSDPIPTILAGIPLDIRSIAISIDRPQFTLNPTSCEPMAVNGQAVSTQNQTVAVSNRFQVGGCQGLPFKPSFQASTQGKTSKANGASLTVKVAQRPGEANIHRVSLTLPTVLPARLTTLQKACTEAQFAANPAGCPAGSFIGTAKAVTPILGVPLTGPAILVSHGGAAFPDVVFLLQGNERGGTIRIDLDGRTDIKKGVTYSRFETVPDAPITSFETNLPQGPHSVLAATGNLCTSKLAMPTELVGQNGGKLNQTTKIAVNGCPKAKVLTRAQKLKLALKVCHKKHGAKRVSCERQARKRYGPLRKAKKSKK